MRKSDHLQASLEDLRSDPLLRTYVGNLAELLNRERGFTPSKSFITQYAQLVIRALHRLANEHLASYYAARVPVKGDPAAILISYNSSVVGFGERDRRITDWIPDQLSADDFSARISSHVKAVWEREWLAKASKRPNVLELHLLAQKRISLMESLPSRLPIYVSAAGTAPPAGFNSGIYLGGEFLPLGKTESKTDLSHENLHNQGIYFSLPMEQMSPAEIGDALGEFVSRLVDMQEESNQPYPEKPITSEDLEGYAAYVRSLLSFKGPNEDTTTPLCLSTIAISDELSNLPLGTAMVIGLHPISHDMAAGISHICFDLFSAFYKIEQEASLLRETALLITAWVHHETTHWSRYVKDQADYVTAEVVEIGGVIEADSRRKKSTQQLVNVVTKLSGIRDDLAAIAETASLSTELLTQLGGPSSSLIGVLDFEGKVRTLLRLYSYVDTSLTIKCDRRFPRALLLVCCELIRNAARHFSDKGAITGDIRIRLQDKSGVLFLSVESEPHDVKDIEALRTLNELSHSMHANLDQIIKEKDQLGGFLIHMLVVVTGGHINWTWEQTSDQRIRVTATWELKVPSGS